MFAKSKLRVAASVLSLGMLASCGGGDSSSSGPISSPAPSPSPTATPTPSPTPTPTGTLASFVEGIFPIGSGESPAQFIATNRGLYFRVQDNVGSGDSKIGKLHGSPAFSNAWSFAEPDNAADTHIWDYAPTNLLNEKDRAIAFEWGSSSHSSSGTTIKWGTHVENTGDVSITLVEPPSIPGTFGFIDAVASGANSGVIASRSWVVERDTGFYQVYQDDGTGTKARTVSDAFSTPATPDLGDSPSFILAHPEDPFLFLAVGRQLLKYDSSHLLQSWTFPGNITDFPSDPVFVGNDLYLAMSDKIYRLQNGDNTLRVVHTFSTLASIMPAGKFCIMGGEIYTADGEAISLGTGTKRNWLSTGDLTSEDQARLARLRGSLGGGVYCRTGNSLIYSQFADTSGKSTILAITPL